MGGPLVAFLLLASCFLLGVFAGCVLRFALVGTVEGRRLATDGGDMRLEEARAYRKEKFGFINSQNENEK